MGFQEVKVEELPDLGTFVQFKAIGDKFLGVFTGYSTGEGKFGIEHRYAFKNRDGLHTVTANFDLHRQLQAANLQPGHAVRITHSAVAPSKDPQKSGMKLFKLEVDADYKAPAPAPKPADDIPF